MYFVERGIRWVCIFRLREGPWSARTKLTLTHENSYHICCLSRCCLPPGIILYSKKDTLRPVRHLFSSLRVTLDEVKDGLSAIFLVPCHYHKGIERVADHHVKHLNLFQTLEPDTASTICYADYYHFARNPIIDTLLSSPLLPLF